MRKGSKLWEHLSHRADLPDEVFPGQTLIEIVDDRRVLIEHHRGVREYGREKICVRVSYGMVQVCGRGLHLRCMTRSQLVISGCIRGITLLGKERP